MENFGAINYANNFELISPVKSEVNHSFDFNNAYSYGFKDAYSDNSFAEPYDNSNQVVPVIHRYMQYQSNVPNLQTWTNVPGVSTYRGYQQNFASYNTTVWGPAAKQEDVSKRVRISFSTNQLLQMEQRFSKNQYISRHERIQLCKVLGLEEKHIKIWFQNRRVKDKRKIKNTPSEKLPNNSKQSKHSPKQVQDFEISSSLSGNVATTKEISGESIQKLEEENVKDQNTVLLNSNGQTSEYPAMSPDAFVNRNLKQTEGGKNTHALQQNCETSSDCYKNEPLFNNNEKLYDNSLSTNKSQTALVNKPQIQNKMAATAAMKKVNQPSPSLVTAQLNNMEIFAVNPKLESHMHSPFSDKIVCNPEIGEEDNFDDLFVTSYHSVPHEIPKYYEKTVMPDIASDHYYYDEISMSIHTSGPEVPQSTQNVDMGEVYVNPKKIRISFTAEQLVELENQFLKNRYIHRQERIYLGRKLGLTEKHIKNWFQNRKAKDLKKTKSPRTNKLCPNLQQSVDLKSLYQVPKNHQNVRNMKGIIANATTESFKNSLTETPILMPKFGSPSLCPDDLVNGNPKLNETEFRVLGPNHETSLNCYTNKEKQEYFNEHLHMKKSPNHLVNKTIFPIANNYTDTQPHTPILPTVTAKLNKIENDPIIQNVEMNFNNSSDILVLFPEIDQYEDLPDFVNYNDLSISSHGSVPSEVQGNVETAVIRDAISDQCDGNFSNFSRHLRLAAVPESVDLPNAVVSTKTTDQFYEDKSNSSRHLDLSEMIDSLENAVAPSVVVEQFYEDISMPSPPSTPSETVKTAERVKMPNAIIDEVHGYLSISKQKPALSKTLEGVENSAMLDAVVDQDFGELSISFSQQPGLGRAENAIASDEVINQLYEDISISSHHSNSNEMPESFENVFKPDAVVSQLREFLNL